MVSTKGYTYEEVREIIHNYELQPHGTRRAWAAEQPFSYEKLKRWRRAFYAGDLERSLVPRDTSHMKHTRKELAEFEKDRAKEKAAHKAEVEKLEARVKQLENANEALGKAIGLLHQFSEQGPDTANRMKSSLPPKTNS